MGGVYMSGGRRKSPSKDEFSLNADPNSLTSPAVFNNYSEVVSDEWRNELIHLKNLVFGWLHHRVRGGGMLLRRKSSSTVAQLL